MTKKTALSTTAAERACIHCGGKRQPAVLSDGAQTWARVSLVPAGTPAGHRIAGPELDATLSICTRCKSVELTWTGR